MDIKDLFIIFFVFSVLGYIAEIFYLMIYSYVRNIEYTHPTFGKLPFSPPYGLGVLFCIWYVQSYPANDVMTSALFCAIAFSSVEYISAIFSEKILHRKYWDYSDIKFNFQGRVCLLNLFLFVIFGLFFIQYLYGPTIQIIKGLGDYNKNILTTILSIIFIWYIFYSEDFREIKEKVKRRIPRMSQ